MCSRGVLVAELAADLHQGEAEQVQSGPAFWHRGPRVVGGQSYAPGPVQRGGWAVNQARADPGRHATLTRRRPSSPERHGKRRPRRNPAWPSGDGQAVLA
jgi:hypothetical protein